MSVRLKLGGLLILSLITPFTLVVVPIDRSPLLVKIEPVRPPLKPW